MSSMKAEAMAEIKAKFERSKMYQEGYVDGFADGYDRARDDMRKLNMTEEQKEAAKERPRKAREIHSEKN